MPKTAGMISASQASRRTTAGGRSRPSAVMAGDRRPARARPAQGLVVEGDQEPGGGAVGVGDGVGVQGVLGDWTRASHSRAPWSRGSRTGAVPCRRSRGRGRVGRRRRRVGQVNGSRAALSRAPSSAEPRPLIRTPPAPSSVIDRYRSVWAARSSRSSAASSRAVDAVGVDDCDQVPAGAGQVGGVQPGGVADQDLLRPPAQLQRTGGRSSTAARSRRPAPATPSRPPSPSRVRTNGPVRALARRTSRLPSPRRRPPRWVTQSPVDP